MLSPKIGKIDEVSDVYPVTLASFLGALQRSEAQGKLSTPEQFTQLLKLCFVSLNFLSVADLSQDESISRAAISKWINGHAVPPAPTRKTVINWIKRATEQKFNQIVSATDSSDGQEEEAIPPKQNKHPKIKHPSLG